MNKIRIVSGIFGIVHRTSSMVRSVIHDRRNEKKNSKERITMSDGIQVFTRQETMSDTHMSNARYFCDFAFLFAGNS